MIPVAGWAIQSAIAYSATKARRHGGQRVLRARRRRRRLPPARPGRGHQGRARVPPPPPRRLATPTLDRTGRGSLSTGGPPANPRSCLEAGSQVPGSVEHPRPRRDRRGTVAAAINARCGDADVTAWCDGARHRPASSAAIPSRHGAAARAEDRGRAGDRAEAVALHRRRGEPGAKAGGHPAGRALLSGRLRDRHLQPGPADPLHAGQPPRVVRRRARLLPVAGHGRCHACRGHPAVHAGVVAAGARGRPARHHAAGRADLLERARGARPGRHPAARRRARPGRPDRDRRRPQRLQPGAAGALLRRLLHGRVGAGVRGGAGRASTPSSDRATRMRALAEIPLRLRPRRRPRTRSSGRSTPSSASRRSRPRRWCPTRRPSSRGPRSR